MKKIIYETVKMVIKMILVLSGGIICGVILLVLVYLLPIDNLLYNFSVSEPALTRNQLWYPLIYDYDASTLDCYSEVLMFKTAATPPPTDENVLQLAMRAYTLSEKIGQQGLKYYEYEYMNKEYSCSSYERYWHGYLVIIKPLLMLFTYQDIIFLNVVMQVSLVIWVIYLMLKKGLDKYIFPLTMFWVLSLPISISLSLEYSFCFYLFMISIILLISFPDLLEKYIYYFLILGIITNYLNYLTWPLITLGIPLTFLIVLREGGGKEKIKLVIMASVSWGVGFVGMWVGKWLVARLILNENVFNNAVIRISEQATVGTSDISPIKMLLSAISKNIGVMSKKTYLLFFVIIILYGLIRCIKCRNLKIIILYMMPFMLIAMIPFAWFIVTANHSAEHYWMTWRILLISIFSYMCGVASLPNNMKRKAK